MRPRYSSGGVGDRAGVGHRVVEEHLPRDPLRLERPRTPRRSASTRETHRVVLLRPRRSRAARASARRRRAARRGTGRPSSRSTGRSAASRCRRGRRLTTTEARGVAARGELVDRRSHDLALAFGTGDALGPDRCTRHDRRSYPRVSDPRVSSAEMGAMAIPNAMHDPLTYAIPFFVAFMALEIVSLRVLADVEPDRYRGVEYRDSRTSILAGLGLAGRQRRRADRRAASATRRCSRSPRCASTRTAGTPGCSCCCSSTCVWYLYHRASHRVRHHVGRPPGAPQQPVLQPDDRGAAEVESLVRAAVLGAAAAARRAAVADLHRVLGQPDLPVLRAHRDASARLPARSSSSSTPRRTTACITRATRTTSTRTTPAS